MFGRKRVDPNAVPVGTAFDCALRMVARRELSESEVAVRLREQGHVPEQIDAAITRLRESNYVNNERFAGMATRSMIGRGKGPRALRARLTEAGIDAETAEGALPEALDWAVQARDTLQRKFGEEPAADQREWSRRARFLLSRGFTESQVRTALGAMPRAEPGGKSKSDIRG